MRNIALLVVGGIFLLVVIAGASWGWRYFTAPVRGIVDAEEQIESSGSRIYRYEQFFDLCAVVQAHEDKLDSQRLLLKELPVDSDQRSMTLTNIAGIEAQRANSIREYNANARKVYTDARFLDSTLPREIPSGAYTDTNKTICR